MKRGGYIARKKPWNYVRKPMKRSPLNPGTKGLQTRTILKARSTSDAALAKERLQALAREIVILRDGGCILRNTIGIPGCSGWKTKTRELVLQADHLVTRANSATYGDTRLIVCICRGHHGTFKKWHKEQYDRIVRDLIGPERAELWDMAEIERSSHRAHPQDWKLWELLLKKELHTLQLKVKDPAC